MLQLRGAEELRIWATGKGQSSLAAVVVTTDGRSTPRSATPAPVIRGVPIAVRAPCDHAGGRGAVPNDSCPRVVLAEWEDRYLRRGRRFAAALRRLPDRRRVQWWPASRFNGVDLLARLDDGSRLIAYFGHASPEGLSGYFGLRHVDFVSRGEALPYGAFLSFACRCLARRRGRCSFGEALVRAGRVAAFLGSFASVATDANERLGDLAADAMESAPSTIAELMRQIDAAVARGDDPNVARVWRTYRLVGDPTAPL